MPFYTITPRRNVHYNPLAPFVAHSHVSRPSASLVPSLFRGLEENFAAMDSFFDNISKPAIRNFQPRFDVREENGAYHLNGEVPGVDAQNLSIEFTDRNTLVISGHIARQSEQGNRPAAVDQQAASQSKGKQPAVEASQNQTEAMEAEPTSRPSTPASTSSNYHKATVEDSREEGDDFVDVSAEAATNTEAGTAAPTPATTVAAPIESAEVSQAKPQEQQQKRDSYYWVSERSVGEFKRSFRFPGLVDQDNVKASLKDGLLEVVVPKAKESGPRRINIE